MKTVEVTRRWSAESVRKACIRHELYTAGTCEDYDRMLGWATRLTPSLENILAIAEDIMRHSEDQTIEIVMGILENEAVTTSFIVDASHG